MQKKSRFGLFFLALLIVVALWLPWKRLAEEQLKAALSAQGFSDISFSLVSAAPHSLTLKDITLGGKFPLTLDELTLDYSLRDLSRRNISELRAGEMKITERGVEITLQGAVFTFAIENGKRQGTWDIASVTLQNAPLELPPLAGKGTWRLEESNLEVKGRLQSADNAYNARFIADYFSDAPQRSQVKVEEARLPWKDGVISTRDAIFPLAKGQVSKIRLRVDKVPLDTLLAKLTNDRAHATGVVTGIVPLIIQSGEPLMVEEAELKAQEPGTITMAPGAIPASNPQLEMLQQVLANFYYDQLTLSVDSGADKRLSAVLAVLGRNPDFQEGRMIKLNVNLTGDVLELMQQSVFPMTDPKQLLKQE